MTAEFLVWQQSATGAFIHRPVLGRLQRQLMVFAGQAIPVGFQGIDSGMFWQLAMWGLWMFTSAVIIALPAVTAILIVNFAFGIMNRAAPQLNIFSLGFPFTMLFGLLIVFISLSGFLPQFESLSEQGLMMMRQLIGA